MLYVTESGDYKIIIMDKTQRILSLAANSEILATFPVLVGQNPGIKEREGYMRTLEGCYFVAGGPLQCGESMDQSRQVGVCIVKVIYEPEIEPHAVDLYLSEGEPNTPVEGWEGFDESACAQFGADGYLVVRRALTPEMVEAARSELQAMTLADDPECDSICFEGRISNRLRRNSPSENSAAVDSGQFTLGKAEERMPELAAAERSAYVRKFMGFTAHHPSLQALASQPGLLQALARIMEDTPVLYQEMAMLKPPQGREKPWHQDHAYFNFSLDTRIVGVWIALEDVNEENGCMFVVPGGHLAGPRPHFLRRDWQICDTDIRPLQRIALPMRAGDVLFFHSKLPHGTPINRTDTMRWAVQYHYIPAAAAPTEDAARMAAFGSEGKDVSC